MTRLSQLLRQERDAGATVALRWNPSTNADRRVSWNEFLEDVALLQTRLESSPCGGWVLLTEDAYAFAVGLLALWHSGRHAISPPNRQLGSLRVLQTRAAGVLTDRPEWFPEGTTTHPLCREQEPDYSPPEGVGSPKFETLDRNAIGIEHYTSGTTGDEKPILKQIRHLEDEVVELGASWDSLAQGACVFATASHQHLYGMLFGVLWPLCSGHVFQARHFLHAGELVPRLRAAERSVLASVPTHLKRFAQHAQSPLLRDRCRAIFSSGGPLLEETALRVANILGAAPIEVLGSTETGGIAWRRRAPDDPKPLWTPFAMVEIEKDPALGTLRVKSPFVSVGGANGFSTGDRVALHGERGFELLGRADRIAKIGERRVDLSNMESQLRGQDWVDDVALTTFMRDGEELSGERAELQERVAAVVIPSEKGWALIRDSGRRAFSSGLRGSLADAWDPILHPRYWRFVHKLPENPQGKVTQDLLRALFQHADWGQSSIDRPEVLDEMRSREAIERACLVPSDLSCFPGHFPDRLVVPGVLQLDWGLTLAEVWMGRAPEVTQIESLKLISPLNPGAHFRIRVSQPQPTRLEIKLWQHDQVFAKARIRIVTPGEQGHRR